MWLAAPRERTLPLYDYDEMPAPHLDCSVCSPDVATSCYKPLKIFHGTAHARFLTAAKYLIFELHSISATG